MIASFYFLKEKALSKFTFRKSFCSPVSKIYILNFLDESERGVLRRLEDDMVQLVNSKISEQQTNNSFCTVFNVEASTQLEQFCREIISDIESNHELPLIHIQGHGSKELGVACLDESYIPWKQLLIFFEKIIHKTNGELTIIAATCHSYQLTKLIDNYGKRPYSFYYGYEKEIGLGLMEKDLSSLYKDFLVCDADITNSDLDMKFSSEYDNLDLVHAALKLVQHPELARKEGLSKRSLRSKVNIDVPASISRKFFNQAISSPDLPILIINSNFHDTDRKRELIDNVKNYFSLYSMGN